MRLTLRTLLAYRDGVLSDEEARTLETKIEESRLASNLIQRIDEGLRNQRIASPAVDGRGLGKDPNSIAEYLDNTLDTETIPELEKLCLENDQFLVEVAACHLFLTQSSQTEVKVSEELRERLSELGKSVPKNTPLADERQVGQAIIQSNVVRVPANSSDGSGDGDAVKKLRFDAAHNFPPPSHLDTAIGSDNSVVESRVVAAGSRVAMQPDTIRQSGLDLSEESELGNVPEYLRGETVSHFRQWALAVALVGLLFFVALQAIGSIDNVKQLLAQDSTNVAQGIDGRSTSDLAVPTPDNAPASSLGNAKNTRGNTTENSDDDNQSSTDANSEIASESPAAPGGTGGEANESVSADLGGSSNAEPDAISSSVKGDNIESTDSDGASRESTQPNRLEGASMESANSNGANSNMIVEQPKASTNSSRKARWLPSSTASANAVVLEQADASKGPNPVRRLVSGQVLQPGHEYSIPPTYETEFLFNEFVQLTARGPCTFKTLERNGEMILQPVFGCFVIEALKENISLTLELDDKALRVLATSSQSSFAMFANTEHAVDSPLSGSGSQRLRMVPLAESVRWQAMDLAQGNAEQIRDGSLDVSEILDWTSAGMPLTTQLDSVPDWLVKQETRPIDLRAADEFSQMIQGDDVLGQITDLLTYRRRQTAAFAARGLMLLGISDGLLGSDGVFERPVMNAYHAAMIEDLYNAVHRSESFRAAVATSLEQNATPEKAQWMQTMLQPISNEQLSQGMDAKLVDSLQSNSVIERLLAIRQLQQIVGEDLGYVASGQNEQAIKEWRRFLAREKIRYPQP